MKPIYFLIAIALLCTPLRAFSADTNFDALSELSLENLGNIVTSVSKKPEDPFKSSAAVTVLTQEDIKLSGATHVAEVLRLVPGLQVARADSSNWAISSRGFNDVFANKLLVLVDGRTVYTPLFSGVYWDIQDLLLDDIERIEVIRGPGATLWGANAVDGVINIITKRAEKTQGVYASQLVGTEDRIISEGRYGGSVGDDLFYRAYAKYADRDASEATGNLNGGNSWDSAKAGFRVDYEANPSRHLTVQGDIYDADINLDIYPPSAITPPASFVDDAFDSRGGNFLVRLDEKHNEDFKSSFQFYYDYQSPSYSLLQQEIHTIDFDYQTTWNFNDRHTVVWGAGYRSIWDDLEGTPTLSFLPGERTTNLYNAFIQDTIAIVPKTVDLTLGTKVEHNDYTGYELQPSARVSWYPSNDQTVWAAVSRAVRTPSRADDDIRLNIVYDPTNFVIIQQQGDRSVDSEELTAYELGYRIRPTVSTSLDIAGFINDYDNLRSAEFQPVQIAPDGTFILPVSPANLGEGQTYGVELSGTWDVSDRWSLTAGYSYITLDLKTKPGSSDIVLEDEENKIPHHQFNLRSQYYLTDDIDITNTLYYVDKLKLYNIDDYVRFDTRIGYKVMPGVDLDLVGQNLFSESHAEFGAPLHGLQNEIERNLYAKVTFRY